MADKKTEVDEKKAERIKVLIECKRTPWIKEDQEYLETLSDERLTDLEASREQKEETKADEKKVACVKALIENTKTWWTLSDREYLEKQSDERLAAFEAVLEDDESENDPKPKPKSIEDWMAEAPKEIQEIVAKDRAATAKQKTGLITSIRASAKDVYSDEELNKMSVENLTKLTQLAKVEPKKDYSGQGTPRQAEGIPDPPKITDKIQTEK